MSEITVEKEGRRHYIVGNTYPIKDALRDAGCRWDGDRKAWWTGKAEIAAQFAGQSVPDSKPANGGGERPPPGPDAIVAGRAEYKGRTYYVVGRTVRGHTHWDDTVDAVTTRDGAKILLAFRDGSKSFWAPRDAVQIVKSYDRPQTIARLRAYADRAKRERDTGICECRCHDEPNAGAPGSTLYDGCERCGCES